MEEESLLRRQVDQFILDQIDSVPHLEALLILWNGQPRPWLSDEMARSLYIPVERTQVILHELQQRGLAVSESSQYRWNPDSTHAGLMPHVDRIYRREIVRISSMIHSKASPAVRQFARAFRLKKD